MGLLLLRGFVDLDSDGFSGSCYFGVYVVIWVLLGGLLLMFGVVRFVTWLLGFVVGISGCAADVDLVFGWGWCAVRLWS